MDFLSVAQRFPRPHFPECVANFLFPSFPLSSTKRTIWLAQFILIKIITSSGSTAGWGWRRGKVKDVKVGSATGKWKCEQKTGETQ